MGSLLLLGAGSSSTSGGGGGAKEIFDILYTTTGGTIPASSVYGNHNLTYDGQEVGPFEDYLSEAEVKTLLEGAYGDVEVALVNKGYRVTVNDPTGNLDDPTVEADTLGRVLNDGTGTGPTKLSQRDYVSPVSEVKEKFTITIPAFDNETGYFSDGSNSGSCLYDNVGNIASYSAPNGYSAGSPGSSSVEFTATALGVKSDQAITSGPGSISVTTQGVDPVTGVAETYTLYAGGSAGDVTDSLGGSISYNGSGSITACTPPTGYSLTAGGAGAYTSATFTANTPGVVSDATVASDTTGGAYITVDAQGVDPVTGLYEVFTYTSGGPISRALTINNGVENKSVSWTSNAITSYGTPTGFVVAAANDTTVTFEQTTGSPVADYSITTSTGGSISYDAQGVAAVAEVLGQCVIEYSHSAGYFTFQDWIASPIILTLSATAGNIKDELNGAFGYNTTRVDNVEKTNPSNYLITINYASGASPTGTISIDGKCGLAVAVSISNVQNGA